MNQFMLVFSRIINKHFSMLRKIKTVQKFSACIGNANVATSEQPGTSFI